MQQHGTTVLACLQGRTAQPLVQPTSLATQQAHRLPSASLMETSLFQDSAALPHLVSTPSLTADHARNPSTAAGHARIYISTLLVAIASSRMEGLHAKLEACAALHAHAHATAHSIPACPAHRATWHAGTLSAHAHTCRQHFGCADRPTTTCMPAYMRRVWSFT